MPILKLDQEDENKKIDFELMDTRYRSCRCQAGPLVARPVS